MKNSTLIVLLTIILVACDGTMPVAEHAKSAEQERIERYLETAEHLNEDQRQAMIQGKPFVGMTYEEASMAMTLDDWQGKFDGKILKGQFKNSAGQTYVLFFDCGTPNRVEQWSAFTDEEVEALSKFYDVHPCSPVSLPFRR